MKALTIRQPWLWAICRGGKTVENRTNRRGAAAAAAQFNRPGPVLLHAATRWDDDAAYDAVRALSPVDPGMSGAPNADPAWYGDGGFVATARIVEVHTWDQCWNQATDELCSPWAHKQAAHITLCDVRVLTRPVPWRGALGLWTVDDPTVLAQVRRRVA